MFDAHRVLRGRKLPTHTDPTRTMIFPDGRPGGGPSKRSKASLSTQPCWLLAACFVTFMISAACMQSYTVFLVAFIEAFGWSRGQTSIAYAVSQFVSGRRRFLSACSSIGWDHDASYPWAEHCWR